MNQLRHLVLRIAEPEKLVAFHIGALPHRIAAYALLLVSLYLARATPAAMAAEKPGWQAEWERTLAGAKKEGAVSLWGDAEITHPDIVAAFTKEFPFIKPITVTGKGGELTVRILAERRAGKYLADVYSGTMSGAAFYEFYRAGVLNPIKPTFIVPDVTDESGWLGGKHHYVDPDSYMILYEGNVAGTSIYYNTQAVKPNEFSSYWDLLAPKWKGKIAMFERPGSGFPSLTPVYYNSQLGPDFIKRLVGEMNVTVSRDRRQATDWLGTGKFVLCIGWQESVATALAVASYAAGVQPFTFADAAVFKIGGTATTTGGETTVAGGTALQTLVRGITITGSSPLATERYGLGNAGVKREQLENAIPEITGTLEAEYTQRTELYDLLKSASSTALELVFEHGTAGTGEPFELSFIFPSIKIREGGPQVGGPDIVGQTIGFKAYDDGGGSNPVMQLRLVSTDTTLAA